MGVGIGNSRLFLLWEKNMSRRVYQGATDISIPIDEIMTQYYNYLEDILIKCAKFSVKEMKKNAQLK